LGKLNQLAVLIGKLDIRESSSNALIHGSTFLERWLSHFNSENEIAFLRVSLCHFGEEAFAFQLLEQTQIHELLRFSAFRIG
jgi:hypothetical protein